MPLADAGSAPGRRHSWPWSILLGVAVAAAYFLLNTLSGLVPGEAWFRAGGTLLFGLVATISWRYGWLSTVVR